MKRILILSCLLLLTWSSFLLADRRAILLSKKPAAAGGGGGISDWSDISGLFAVYDANLLVTNTSGNPAGNSEQLKSWGDSSGNGHHALTNGITTTLEFSSSMGTNHGISMGSLRAAFTALPNSTILVAARSTAGGANSFTMDSTNSSARQTIFKDGSDLPSIFSGTTIAGGTALANNLNYTFIATFNSGGNDTLYTNSVQAVTGDAGSASLDGLTIGSNQAQTITWGDFMGLIVIYNRVLNSTEIGQIDALAVARGWR